MSRAGCLDGSGKATHTSTVIHCYSKKFVGYAIAGRMRCDLIIHALDMAPGLVPHNQG